MTTRAILPLLAAAALALGPRAAAQPAAPTPPGRGLGYGFSGLVGYGGATGPAAGLLDDTWGSELDAFVEKGSVRAGVGLDFHRFRLPSGPGPELAAAPLSVYAAWSPFRGRVRPYLLARAGLVHVRPMITLELAASAASGWSYGVFPGVEVDLGRGVSLDASAGVWGWSTGNAFGESETRLEDAAAWTGRLGLTWRPARWPAADANGRVVLGPWGVRRNPALAAGELGLVLAGGVGYNEYPRDARFGQISPRTWARNFERGAEFDGNKFDTNHFYHPWNGAVYYAIGRSNGLGFLGSSLTALAGSVAWECCGEAQQMSTNDLVSTSLGGIAMGEAMHRLGSAILDNRDRGASRLARELAVLVIDTPRGVNRALSGEQRRAENPADPFERRPPRLGALLSLGVRRVGDGGDLSAETGRSAMFTGLWVGYGSVFDNERRKPYDSFWLQAQVNFADRIDPLGEMTIRGDLASKPLAGGRGALAFVQHFDYVNQRTYEFAGQSFGATLSRRFGRASGSSLELHGGVVTTVLGCVPSRFELVAAPPEGSEYRRYEYGPGLGAHAEALFVAGRHPVALLAWRYQWIHTVNDTPLNGGGADHQLNVGTARLSLPLGGRLGIGVDAELFLRRSRYGNALLLETDRRVPQFRVYAAYRLGGF